MTSRLVVTVLPRDEWDAGARVSLHFSLYLEVSSRGAVLGDIPFARSWPQTVRTLVFGAHLKTNGAIREIGKFKPTFLVEEQQATDLWSQLVPDATPLGPTVARTAGRVVRGYDVLGLVDAVETFYDPLRAMARRKSSGTGNPLSGLDWWGVNELQSKQALGQQPSTASKFLNFAQYHLPLAPPTRIQADPGNFNQSLGEIAQYPALQRLLGFVVDAELELAVGQVLPPTGALAVSLSPNTLAGLVQVVSPWSNYATRKAAGSTYGYMAAAPLDKLRVQGFYRLAKQQTALIQYPLDGSVFGIMKAARATHEAVTHNVAASNRQDAPPAISTFGYSLYHTGILDDLQNVERRHAELEKQSGIAASGTIDAAAPDLYASDVQRGFRVDVLTRDHGPWRSLVARTHTLLTNRSRVPLDHLGPSESMVTLALSRGSDGAERTTQRLFGWIGWSLASPKPENPVNADGDPTTLTPPAGLWQVIEAAAPASLPRLRFGRMYRFRCRQVDLAGNSWSPSTATAVADGLPEVTTDDDTFRRWEPLSAPLVDYDSRPGRGEKPRLMVVYAGGAQLSARTVHPPPASFDLVERHGAIDGLEANEAYGVFALATTRRTPPTDGESFKAYVADPAARGVRMLLEGGSSEQDVGAIEFRPGLIREAAGGVKIVLTGGSERATIQGREVTVHLPAGESRQLRIWSEVEPRLRSQFEFDDPTQANPPDQVAPSVNITLVHAVPVPRTPPVLAKPNFLDRKRKETYAAFSDPDLTTDAETTARVTFRADWTERFDDPAKPDWTEHQRSAVIATQEIEPPHNHPLGFTAARQFDPKKRLSARPTIRKINTAGVFSQLAEPSNTFDFQDTLSRHLSVTPLGHTRHAEYFAQIKGVSPPVAAGVTAPVLLRSTANPTPPSSVYILPSFMRRRKHHGRHWTQTTEGWALRVYLKRDWRYGEQLALLFGRGVNAETYSAIGQDPLVYATKALSPLKPTDIRGAAISSLKLPLSDTYLDTGVDTAADVVDIIPFEPVFDPIKNLRFADVLLRPQPGTYQPFVRFGLARYNPDAIAGAELSPAVIADWAQPFPNRSVSVSRAYGGKTVVTVSADAADETPGRSRNRFFAFVEYTELYYDDEYGWNPVLGSETELLPTGSGSGNDLQWQASIPVRQGTLLGRRRIVVREVFDLPGDDCHASGGLRLMAFDIIEI